MDKTNYQRKTAKAIAKYFQSSRSDVGVLVPPGVKDMRELLTGGQRWIDRLGVL